MSNPMLRSLFSQWFGDHVRMVYFNAYRSIRRMRDRRGLDFDSEQLEELVQDAVARAYARFVRRCDRNLCPPRLRKAWICQCLKFACQDTMRHRSTFGSVSAPMSYRDDAMSRGRRLLDHEAESRILATVALGIERKPTTDQDIERVVAAELPADLRPFAMFAARGFTRWQIGALLGVSERTVRARLAIARKWLEPIV